ncbi:MAG: DUF4929 family protein, partial [Bacteroides sp.]|nr:DUF4929 family protein [Bacteroides sp.]
MKPAFLKFYGLMGLLMVLLSACSSSDNKVDYTGTNEVLLSYQGNATDATMEIGEERELTASILLTSRLNQSIDFELSASTTSPLLIMPAVVRIPAGENEASFVIKAVSEAAITEATLVRITATPTSSQDKVKLKNTLTVTVLPATEGRLTADQRALVETYRTRLGLDLTPILGKLKVETTVYEPGGSNYTAFAEENTYTYKGEVVLTLSEKSTVQQPVLKMVRNAMGLNDYVAATFKKLNVLDTEYWNNPDVPSPKALMETLNYTVETAVTANVVLDNIRINPQTKHIAFVDKLAAAIPIGDDGAFNRNSEDYPPQASGSELEKIVVPLYFDINMWTLAKERLKTNPSIQQWIVEGGRFEPYSMFNRTGIDTDENASESEKSNYQAPEASFDSVQGTLTFKFCFEAETESAAYTRVEVRITR